MLTPVELHQGIYLKREDLYTLGACNGSKLRACQFLIERAHKAGKRHVVSAASVLSPQSAMAATVAASLGMKCTVVICSKASTMFSHPSIAVARDEGAEFELVRVGYNPYLQSMGKQLTAALGVFAWQLPYGITTPADADLEYIRDFVAVGAEQTANLPDSIKTLVIPFGSGNTAAGVLAGVAERPPESLERVVLMGIGPDRQQWLYDRLSALEIKIPVPVQHIALHPGFATYGDSMREVFDGVLMHPTYEGKVVRWANQYDPDWWTARDGTTCLWVVGGPVGAR